MKVETIRFRGRHCFKEWSGIDSASTINVIIGRNNTGKSRFLDFVQTLCDGPTSDNGWEYSFSGVFLENALESVFPENTSGGALGGNHWQSHGRKLINKEVSWDTDDKQNPVAIRILESDFLTELDDEANKARFQCLQILLKNRSNHVFSTKEFCRLEADRDLHPETPRSDLNLKPDGEGATKIIRRYIVSSNPELPRDLIQTNLLHAMNQIFRGDARFTEIEIQHHEDASDAAASGTWEVFLGEEKKGLIPLSLSGSGLKKSFWSY